MNIFLIILLVAFFCVKKRKKAGTFSSAKFLLKKAEVGAQDALYDSRKAVDSMGEIKKYNLEEMDKSISNDLSGKIHGKSHTHDILDTDCFDPKETAKEHYEKQLKELKRAGLMTSKEYQMMIEKYKNIR